MVDIYERLKDELRLLAGDSMDEKVSVVSARVVYLEGGDR